MVKIAIEIENVTKIFEDNGKRTVALRDVNMKVHEGEFVAVVGPSGCGKTTLLRLVAGLLKPTRGRILMDGDEIKGPGADRGMVFQEYALFPWRKVDENIEFGLEIMGLKKDEREKISQKYIELTGLKGFENAYPHELSGGMKQRVAIARAFANNPKVLLMDEPFGSLDAQTKNIMEKELLRVWGKEKKTVLYVTHCVEEAIFLADRVYVLTARPGTVKEVIDVNLPRPRTRTSRETALKRQRVFKELCVEVEKAMEHELRRS